MFKLHEYYPVVNEVGFFETNINSLVDTFAEWQAKIVSQWNNGVQISVEPVNIPFPFTLRKIGPLTSIDTRRFLFVKTRGPWVAYFENRYPIPDVQAPVAFLPYKLKCRSIRATYIPDGSNGVLGGFVFSLFGPNRIGLTNNIRSVFLYNEGKKWRFDQEGDLLPFESIEELSLPKLKQRFYYETLVNYLAQFEILVEDKDFFIGEESFLVSKVGPLFSDCQEYKF